MHIAFTCHGVGRWRPRVFRSDGRPNCPNGRANTFLSIRKPWKHNGMPRKEQCGWPTLFPPRGERATSWQNPQNPPRFRGMGKSPGGTKEIVPSPQQLSELFAALQQRNGEHVVVTKGLGSKLKKNAAATPGRSRKTEHPIPFAVAPPVPHSDISGPHPAKSYEIGASHYEQTPFRNESGVAQHYSRVASAASKQTLQERRDTPTSRLRATHNWIKNVLVGCAAGLWGEGAALQIL